jgi:hypothetical protein
MPLYSRPKADSVKSGHKPGSCPLNLRPGVSYNACRIPASKTLPRPGLPKSRDIWPGKVACLVYSTSNALPLSPLRECSTVILIMIIVQVGYHTQRFLVLLPNTTNPSNPSNSSRATSTLTIVRPSSTTPVHISVHPPPPTPRESHLPPSRHRYPHSHTRHPRDHNHPWGHQNTSSRPHTEHSHNPHRRSASRRSQAHRTPCRTQSHRGRRCRSGPPGRERAWGGARRRTGGSGSALPRCTSPSPSLGRPGRLPRSSRRGCRCRRRASKSNRSGRGRS